MTDHCWSRIRIGWVTIAQPNPPRGETSNAEVQPPRGLSAGGLEGHLGSDCTTPAGLTATPPHQRIPGVGGRGRWAGPWAGVQRKVTRSTSSCRGWRGRADSNGTGEGEHDEEIRGGKLRKRMLSCRALAAKICVRARGGAKARVRWVAKKNRQLGVRAIPGVSAFRWAL